MRANPRAGSLPGLRHRRAAGGGPLNMLKIDNPHAYYGKSHVLHGVSFDVRPGEIVGLAWSQRLGPIDHGQGHHKLVDWEGTLQWKGQSLSGKKAYEVAPPGPGRRAREPRRVPQPHGAPEPAAGPEGQRQRQPLGPSTTCTPCSRACTSAAQHRGRCDVRRRAADADTVPHAHGRPRPHHHR